VKVVLCSIGEETAPFTGDAKPLQVSVEVAELVTVQFLALETFQYTCTLSRERASDGFICKCPVSVAGVVVGLKIGTGTIHMPLLHP